MNQLWPIHAYLIRDGQTPVLAAAPFWQSYGHLAIETAYALEAARTAGADLWLIPPPAGAANPTLYQMQLGKTTGRVYEPPQGYEWFSKLKTLGMRPWSGCKPRTQADLVNPGPYFFRKLLAGLEPLRLPAEVEKQGLAELEAMGVKAPWVAVHAKHGSVRGVDISTYGAAIDWLHDQGLYIVRCGDPGGPVVQGKRVLDLANHPQRTSLAEVMAVRSARLFIGCHSGPWAVAQLFNVPSVITNVSDPFAPYPLHGHSRYLLKPAGFRGGRQLTVLEQLEGGYLKALMDPGNWRLAEDPYMLTQGDNSAEEILAAAQEVLQGIDTPPQASRGQVRWRQNAERAAAHWSAVLPYVRKWAGSDGGWLGNGALAQVQAEVV